MYLYRGINEDDIQALVVVKGILPNRMFFSSVEDAVRNSPDYLGQNAELLFRTPYRGDRFTEILMFPAGNRFFLTKGKLALPVEILSVGGAARSIPRVLY